MKLSLSLNGKVTALTVLLLPILLSLGFWQLERSEEKREIEARFLARQAQAARPIEQLDQGTDLAFTRVILAGQFDNVHTFLLDNRVHEGQLGYEVLSPFLTSSGQWILVNRGWVRGRPDRRTLPPVPEVNGELSVVGSVYVPPGSPFLLAEQVIDDANWPLVVQAVEIDKFAEALNRRFFPHVVRLQAGAPGALAIDWQRINLEPEKHTAYAVQWFVMAAALVIWFVFANTNLREMFLARPRKSESNNDRDQAK